MAQVRSAALRQTLTPWRVSFVAVNVWKITLEPSTTVPSTILTAEPLMASGPSAAPWVIVIEPEFLVQPLAICDCTMELVRAGSTSQPGTVSPLTGRSEEHTSELQSRFGISYAVFCL